MDLVGRVRLKEPWVQRAAEKNIGIQPDAPIFTEHRDAHNVLQKLGENRVTGDLHGDSRVILEGLWSEDMNRVIRIVPFPTGTTMEIQESVFVSPCPNDSWSPMLTGCRETDRTYHERHQNSSHHIPRIHLFMGRDCSMRQCLVKN